MKRVDKYILLEQKEYDRLIDKITNMEGEGSSKSSPELLNIEENEKTSSAKDKNILDQLKSSSQKEESIDKESIEQLKNIISEEIDEKPSTNIKNAKNIKLKRPAPPPGIPDKKRKINPYQSHQWKKFWSAK